jgi:hypothetical protein
MSPQGAVTQDDIAEIREWMDENASRIPEEVLVVVSRLLEMTDQLFTDKISQKKSLELLRMYMGILPKSERGKTDKFAFKDQAEGEAEQKKAAKSCRKQLLEYQKRFQRTASASKSGERRKSTGVALLENKEQIMPKASSIMAQCQEKDAVTRSNHFKEQKNLRSEWETHIRYDVSLMIKRIEVSVETVTDVVTGKRVRAEVHQGPPGYQVTWQTIAFLVTQAVGFAVPLNRLAIMLSTDWNCLGVSEIYRLIAYATRAATPVYLKLFEELAQCPILSGDDSPTKVLAVEKKKALDDLDIFEGRDPTTFTPEGEEYRELLNSREMKDHVELVDGKLGKVFASQKTGKSKQRVHVSFLKGRQVDEDCRSTILFYRTHVGSLGNLLTKLFQHRDPAKKEVLLQSDLSTSNLPRIDAQKFSIQYAGCTAHARRPFWRYRDVDEENTYFILRGMAILSDIEEAIDDAGRTFETVAHYRQRYARKVWEIMNARCLRIMDRWPPSSELHKGARYLVSNYEILTTYLANPRLRPSNNHSERALRAERLMLNNSKFRKSETGRLAFDVLRTLQVTCSAAEVSFMDYLIWLMKNQDEAKTTPERFTPYQYALKNGA